MSFLDLIKQIVLDFLGMMYFSYVQFLFDSWQVKMVMGYFFDGSKVEGQWYIYLEMVVVGFWIIVIDLVQVFIELQKGVVGEEMQVLELVMVQQMFKFYFEDFVGLGMFLENNGEEWYFLYGGWDEGFFSEVIVYKMCGYGVVVLINFNYLFFISEFI